MRPKTFRADVYDIDARVRRDVPGALNLKSLELIHPEAQRMVDEVRRELRGDAIRLYPYLQAAAAEVAAASACAQESVLFSAGSDPMIGILVDALGSAFGRIVTPSPEYFGWGLYAPLRRVEIVPVRLALERPRGFRVDPLLDAIDAQPPCLVALSNPNSPTGHVFPPVEIREIARRCEARGHLLVIDECFAPFAGLDHRALLPDAEHVIWLRSYSKCFALAGARIASTIAAPEIASYLARWRPDAAVSSTALELLRAMLRRRSVFESVWKDIATVREWFAAAVVECRPGWTSLPSGGNFVNFALPPGEEPAQVAAWMLERGYRIADVSHHSGLERCVRFGVADRETMAGVLHAVEALNG